MRKFLAYSEAFCKLVELLAPRGVFDILCTAARVGRVGKNSEFCLHQLTQRGTTGRGGRGAMETEFFIRSQGWPCSADGLRGREGVSGGKGRGPGGVVWDGDEGLRGQRFGCLSPR